jgi:hypothetical protein
MIHVEDAARRLLAIVAAGRQRIVHPWQQHLLCWLIGRLPPY